MVIAAGLAYFTAGWRVALLAVAGLAFAGIGGVWDVTMDTLSQVLTAGLFTVVVGIGIGVVASQSRAFESVLRPFLDTMQTMPIFVYLIPVIMLWGIGAPGRHHSHGGVCAASGDPHDQPWHQGGAGTGD